MNDEIALLNLYQISKKMMGTYKARISLLIIINNIINIVNIIMMIIINIINCITFS